MSKTTMTPFRLTEDERLFLARLGDGDMTRGLRELMNPSPGRITRAVETFRAVMAGDDESVRPEVAMYAAFTRSVGDAE